MRLDPASLPPLSMHSNLKGIGATRGLTISDNVADLAHDVVEFWLDETIEYAFDQHDETGESSWWDAYCLLSAIRRTALG